MMTPSKPDHDSLPPGVILTDRTTIETDWECGQKRWWYKEEGGIGIVPVDEPDYFQIGKEIHDDNDRLANGTPIDVILNDIMAGIPSGAAHHQLEPIYRRMGWIAAYNRYVEPRLQEEFEDVLIEDELVLDRTPLWINVIPDRVQRFRAGPNKGRLVYREYKSAKFVNEGWINYWPTAIQLHLGIAAIEEELQEPIAYAIVESRLKGQESYGRLNHPYVWAKVDDGGKWWMPADNKKQLTYMPIWDYPGGVKEWVEKCGEDVAKGQFIQSRPVFLNRRLVEEVVKQRLYRENKVIEFRNNKSSMDIEEYDSTMAGLFEKRTSKCNPVIGSPCPYRDACFNKSVGDDPIGSGIYKKRIPHHELEIISLGED